MKKAISLILALVMCLSLCACGGGESNTPNTPETTEAPTETTVPEETVMTKDEMLASAVHLEMYEINNASVENIAKAKMDYCNKILQVNGQITQITEEYIVISSGDYAIDVYLPLEELITLTLFQQVIIVGETTDEIVKAGFGGHYQMPVAYLVTDRYNIRCVIQTSGIKLMDADGKQLDGIRSCHWAEGVDKSQYDWQEVTISAKIIYNTTTGKPEYYDATIVE